MRNCMRIFSLGLMAALLSGCGEEPEFDGSSYEAMMTSEQVVMADLSNDEQKKIKDVLNELRGLSERAANLANGGGSALSKNDLFEKINILISGRSAKEVVAMHDYIQIKLLRDIRVFEARNKYLQEIELLKKEMNSLKADFKQRYNIQS